MPSRPGGCIPISPGDGREYVVSDPAAVKIRAEDGRRVEAVDISPFITGIPGGKDTRSFSSEDASGSTSQAATIMEALEAGARLFCIDEDTSATNFMIRDRRMQALVAKEHEPITPYIDRVRELFTEFGVSSVIVIGGSGDYLDVADTVICMDAYRPDLITDAARKIAVEYPTGRIPETGQAFPPRWQERIFDARSFSPAKGKRAVRIQARGKGRSSSGRPISTALQSNKLFQRARPVRLRMPSGMRYSIWTGLPPQPGLPHG